MRVRPTEILVGSPARLHAPRAQHPSMPHPTRTELSSTRIAREEDGLKMALSWQGINARFERWMYAGGRPNRVARLLNRGWATAHAAGLWPSRLVTLEVRGRRTGRVISFPLVMAEYGGEHYLVSMLGQNSNWVRNVRAAGGRAVLRHGRRDAVRLTEIDADARAPILRQYLSLAPAARAFIAIDRDARVEDFERIAPCIPIFHVTSDQTSREVAARFGQPARASNPERR